MATRRTKASGGRAHRFGGDWTSTKLRILGDYLRAYTTALKKTPFETVYVDAFAGTGFRTPGESDGAETEMFADLFLPDPQAYLEGSATIALKTEPRFSRYLFIERSARRVLALEGLKTDFPHLAPDIEIRRGDANEEIRTLCAGDWRRRRAVIFLDPYGMQVEWPTIAAIASTHAIDLWILFPLGAGVNRLLTRSGEIPASWRRRLDLLLGTTDWYEAFYRVDEEPTLFPDLEPRVVKVTTDVMGRYFNDRLRTVFAGVAEPKVLLNSARCPLYLLCFAAANERGAPVALKIANHLLR